MISSISHFLAVPHVNKYSIPKKYDRYGQDMPNDCLWTIFTYCIEKDSCVGRLSRVCKNWTKSINCHEFIIYLIKKNRKVSAKKMQAVTLHAECPSPLLRWGWNAILPIQFSNIINASLTFKDRFSNNVATSRITRCADWVGTLSIKEASYISSIKLHFNGKIDPTARFKQILRILQYLPCLRKIDLDAFDFDSKQISRIVASCPNVRDLELIIKYGLENHIFSMLKPMAKQIYRLWIKGHPMALFTCPDNRFITQFMNCTSSLLSLSLDMRLSLDPWFYTCITRNPTLRHISLKNALFDDTSCMILARTCRQLETLEMNISPPVTNQGIISILQQCTQLTNLTLKETHINFDIDAAILDVVEAEALSLENLTIHYKREEFPDEQPLLKIDATTRERFKASRPGLRITYHPPYKRLPSPPREPRVPGGPLR